MTFCPKCNKVLNVDTFCPKGNKFLRLITLGLKCFNDINDVSNKAVSRLPALLCQFFWASNDLLELSPAVQYDT